MYTRKKLPKTQYELSKGVENKEFGRANDIRRDNDTLQDLSIGLFDLDYTIKYYFDNIIKPEITEAGAKIKVPVVYGSPEKWKNVQADGYFRDKNGKIQSPLIAYKRTAITKNKTLTNKVDANFPNVYNTQEVKYTQVNKYDQFSKLTNSKPIKTFINTVVPDYVDITYDVVIWTDYIEGMNNIVESVLYSEGSYWGDIEKFKFRTKIDSFTNTTDLLQDADRIVRTSFQLTLYGYIIPDVMARELSKKQSEKSFDVRQIIIETDVDVDPKKLEKAPKTEDNRDVTFTTPTYRVAPNPDLIDKSQMNYIYVNKPLLADTITVPDTAHFTGAFLLAPVGLPPTSISNFMFFINGQYVESAALISFVDSGSGVCTLVLDTAELGFTLALTDEIVAVGKFA
jgi:hypothetical protein